MEFEPFPKIARLNRDCVITEKIDGTNSAVLIEPLGPAADWGWTEESATSFTGTPTVVVDDIVWRVRAQSRKRLITPGKGTDNFGFAAWVHEHARELVEVLGEGRHFGEWWGQGIQRGYGLDVKVFSLFNTGRWDEHRDDLVLRGIGLDVVPVLYRGPFSTEVVSTQIERLRTLGSVAAPGFPNPEGLVVWHEAARQMFKVTVKDDEKPKGQVA